MKPWKFVLLALAYAGIGGLGLYGVKWLREPPPPIHGKAQIWIPGRDLRVSLATAIERHGDGLLSRSRYRGKLSGPDPFVVKWEYAGRFSNSDIYVLCVNQRGQAQSGYPRKFAILYDGNRQTAFDNGSFQVVIDEEQ